MRSARLDRMPKRELMALCDQYGLLYPPNPYKYDLIDLLEAYFEPSPTIFGYASVQIEKVPGMHRWELFTPQGTSLVYVSWRLIYTFDQEMAGRADIAQHRAALEACLAVEPLEPDELLEVSRKWPEIVQYAPYEVDANASVWELAETQTPRVTPTPAPAPEPEPVPEPEPETRQLSLNRKISI